MEEQLLYSMKASDYIAKRIKAETDTVFGVTGGCIINLVDSFMREGFHIVSMFHEQSAAIAADAYARFKGIGVCYATSGPGTTNLLTGVCCSYYDSVPVLAIGGQVPTSFLTGRDRQMGFQEVPGVDIFKPVVKKSRRYCNNEDLNMCLQIAKVPRRGPTFLEIPDDLQRQHIPPPKKSIYDFGYMYPNNDLMMAEINDTIKAYKKPILIVGAGADELDLDIGIPFLYTWRTKDKYFYHKMCRGGFGITGGQHGNKLLKEADIIVMLGTRMDSHQAPDWGRFAPQAYKLAIGMEFPHKADRWINIGLKGKLTIRGNNWCQKVTEEKPNTPAYRFIDKLSASAPSDEIIIPDMGQAGCIAFQRWALKRGQRLFNGMNHSPMGYSIPASIGAHLATGRHVIVIIGDGSLMMALPELQTIAAMKLPINIFVVNNGGYGMIRQTQDDWKGFLLQGTGANFAIPDIRKLASAFGLWYTSKLSDRPSIFEVKIEDTKIIPKHKYGEEI